LLQGHVAGSWLACCPPRPSGPSLQSCSPASHSGKAALFIEDASNLKAFSSFNNFSILSLVEFLHEDWRKKHTLNCYCIFNRFLYFLADFYRFGLRQTKLFCGNATWKAHYFIDANAFSPEIGIGIWRLGNVLCLHHTYKGQREVTA